MPLDRLFTISDVVMICRLQDEIDELKSKLKKKEKEIDELKSKLEKTENEIAKRKKQLKGA